MAELAQPKQNKQDSKAGGAATAERTFVLDTSVLL